MSLFVGAAHPPLVLAQGQEIGPALKSLAPLPEVPVNLDEDTSGSGDEEVGMEEPGDTTSDGSPTIVPIVKEELPPSNSQEDASQLSASTTDTALPPQIAEGVATTRDKKGRNPVVTVQQVYPASGGTKLLVDAYVPSDEFQEYPLQFDFYVNRRLFVSQFRSPELPGPVGIDVGSDVATPPYNYAVVVKVLHPSAVYTSVVQGAFEGRPQAPQGKNLSCTLNEFDSTDAPDSPGTEYKNNSVTFTVAQDGSYAVAFTASSSDGEDAKVQGTITVDASEAASGSLTITQTDQVRTVVITGDATLDSDRALSTLDVSSADDSLTLSCAIASDVQLKRFEAVLP